MLILLLVATSAHPAPPACELTADIEQGDGLCIEPVRVLRYEQQAGELATCSEHLARAAARESVLADTVDTLADIQAPKERRVTLEGVALGAAAVLLGAAAVRLVAEVR